MKYPITNDVGIITRPYASPGYWLCSLLPLALLVNIIRYPYTTEKFEYRFTTITSIGLLLQSINFFIYLHYNAGICLRLFLVIAPGIISSILYGLILHQNISVCLFWGIGSVLLYQYAYIKTLRNLPECFTFGEASIVVQGVILFAINTILQIPIFLSHPSENIFDKMNSIMMSSILCICLMVWLISSWKIFRHPISFYTIMIMMVLHIFTSPVTTTFPLLVVINFILSDPKRIFTISLYLGLVGLASVTTIWQTQKHSKASTSVRKIFHIIIVFIIVPGALLQCTFLYLSSGVALSGLILIEVVRIVDIQPFGKYLNQLVESFTDDKDSGIIKLTPIYLLIGCCLPLWLHPCPCGTGDIVFGDNLVPILSGVISIGIGDTIASIFGSNFGKHKWPNSKKSIEGTIASIIFQSGFVGLLQYFKLFGLTAAQIGLTLNAIIITSLVEAFTDQIDNLVLPLGFYVLSSFI